MTAFARVAELADQIRGVTYAKEDATSSPRPGYLPVLRAGNIADDGLVFDDLVFVPAERISPTQKIRRNDVVIAASSGSLDVVGKAARALTDFEGGFGAFCKVLRPGPGIDPAYFAHFFRTRDYRQRVSALAAGANINNLRNEHLDEFRIPLPPLPEQRRIAEILDKADALRAKRRAALAQLDTLTQSIFLDMFGDPATNPMGLPKASLEELFEIARVPPRGAEGCFGQHQGQAGRDPGQQAVQGEEPRANLARRQEPGEQQRADAELAGEPLRVAGAFTIDGFGAPFLDGIDGDASNVAGLSLPVTRALLADLGVRWTDLWR